MMTTASTSISTNLVPFDDIFHELNDELDQEAHDWHLDDYYLRLDHQIRNAPRTPTSRQEEQDRSELLPASEHTMNNDHACGFLRRIPDYLLPSSSSFRTTFFSELRDIYRPIAFEDLQQLALLVHQMGIIHLHQQLWQRFLQSGTGQLRLRAPRSVYLHPRDGENRLAFWPAIVANVVRSQRFVHDDTVDHQDAYVHFVRNYLDQLEKKSQQYRLLFSTTTTRVLNYTSGLADKIDRFVQREGTKATRLHFELRMALLEYIYMDRSYQLGYVQQEPTNSQLQVAKQICSLTFEKEKAEQEVIYLKFGVLFHRLPRSLNILEGSLPTTITTISDVDTRERLSAEYLRVIQRAKADLTSVLVGAAEARKMECQRKFDRETAAIWNHQRSLRVHERLTAAMIHTIEQRQKNIIHCVKDVYKLKDDFFLQNPPPPSPPRRTTAIMF